MEWTQPFPRGSAAPQRHALLHDLHDIGVRFQVVDERGWEEAQGSTPSVPRQ
jgi:hypothetical protein